jgi:CshA-type fibril repeat protein
LLVNGTVTSVTCQIDMANSGGITGTGIGYRDQWNITASIPEDLGLVPASYEVGGLAAHVVTDLKMGSIVTSDQVSSDANSTYTPAAVAAGAAIPAHADDGVAAWPALDERDAGTTYTVPISLAGVNASAYLCGWIDFNRDGTFTPGERACATNPTSGATSGSISWTVPQDVKAGLTYMRLRLSFDPLPLPTGVVASGEVEDYSMVMTGPPPPGPVALPDATQGPFNTAQSINLLTNDTASQGSTLVASSVKLCNPNTNPAQVAPNCSVGSGSSITVANVGTYSVSSTGVVTFTPVAGYTGTPAPLKYQVADANGQIADSNYTPTVFGPPTATPNTTTGPLNTAQTANILTNDAAATGATLLASSVKLCNPTTTPAQTPPNCSVAPGSTISVPNVGSYSVDATGVITFTPVTGYTGTPTPLKYQVADNLGQVANSTYTPTVIGAPTASPNTTVGPLDTPQSFNLLTNDSAATGASLVASSIKLCDPTTNPAEIAPNCTVAPGSNISVPNVGTYEVSSAGVVTFTPVAGYTGTPTALGYQISDNLGQVASSTYTPTIVPPPTANPETTSGPMNTPQTSNLATNDAPGAGGSLQISSIKLCDPSVPQLSPNCTIAQGSTLTVAGVGTYSVSVLGVITYTPVTGYTGTPAPLNYQISDALGQVASSTYTPKIIPRPTATPNTTTGPLNTAQSINVTTNDSAATGATLNTASVKLCSGAQVAPNCTATSVTVTGVGTYAVNTATGVVTFTPVTGYTGTPAGVTYQVADNLGQVASSTYTPSIYGATTASPNTTTGPLDASQSVNLVTNDVAGVGTTLDPSSVKLCDPTTTPAQVPNNCLATSVSVPNVGTYSVDANGVVTFTPVSGYTGTPTPLKYQVRDSQGQIANSTYTPKVIPGPTATANATTGVINTPQTVNLLTNDAAASGATLDAASVKLCDPTTTPAETAPNCTVGVGSTVTVPGVGTYSVNSSGVMTFTPDAGYIGTPPALGYQVADNLGQIASSSYTPTVLDAPTANPNTTEGPLNTAQTANIVTDDAAASGTTIVVANTKLCNPNTSPVQVVPNCTATTVTVAGVGTYALATTGVVTFTPVTGYTGTPTPLAYQVVDTAGQAASSTYTPTVYGKPTAMPNTTTGALDVNQTANLLTNDTAGAGTSLVPSTVKLCDSTASPAQVPNNCLATTVTLPNVGTYTVDSNGVVTFDPLPSFVGTPPAMKYQISDNKGQTANSTYTPTVIDVPTAVPNTTTGPLNTAQSVNILTNDSAASGTTLVPSTLKLCDPTTSPAESAPNCSVAPGSTITVAGVGTYSVSAAGLITFTPDNGYTGAPTPLSYQVSDALGQVATSTYTPNVYGAPTATANTTAGPLNTAQSVNVTTNDTAGAGTILNPATVKLCGASQTPPNCSATSVTVAGVGTYTVASTGVVTFTPVTGYTGTPAGVTYQVADNKGQIASSTYTPTVYGAPAATSNTTTGGLDQNQSTNLLTNDTPGAGTTLDASTVKLCDPTTSPAQTPNNCSATTVTVPNVGTYSVDANGVVTFDPLPTFTGSPAALKYQVTDNKGQTANSTYTPTVVGVPVASPNTTTGLLNAPQSINILTNDAAATNGTLVAASVKLCDPTTSPAETAPNCTVAPGSTITVPGVGTYSVTAAGVITFTPENGYVGTPPALDYQVSDALGQVASSTYTPTVYGTLVANPETTIGPLNTPQSVNVATNDVPGLGTALVASSVKLCSSGQTPPNCTATSVTVAGVGTYTVSATGVVTFTPVSGYTGTPAGVRYQVSDNAGQVGTSTYTPTVYGAPTALPNTTSGPLDANQTVNLLTNDTAGAGTVLVPSTVKLCAPSGATIMSISFNTLTVACSVNPGQTVVVAGVGSYSVDATGVITFDPLPTFTGTPPALTYQISDDKGQPVTSTYTPTVIGAPTATPNTTIGPLNTAQSVNILTNDAAATGTTLVASMVKLCDPTTNPAETAPNCTVAPGSMIAVPGVGTYSVAATGVITFTPETGYTGTPAPLDYQVSDALGQIASSTYTPTVYGLPTALPNTTIGPLNTAQSVNIFADDTAGSGTTLNVASLKLCSASQTAPNCTATSVTVANVGTYSVNTSTGVVTFTPVTGYTGTPAGVSYQVSDNKGQVASSTYTPTVYGAPTASPNTTTGPVDTPQTANIVANDSAGFGTTLDLTTLKLCAPIGSVVGGVTLTAATCTVIPGDIITVPNVGTYCVDSAGVITFTPVAGYTGTPAPLSYTISDTRGQTATSTYTPHITPAPALMPDAQTSAWNTPQNYVPLTNDHAATGTTLVPSTLRLCDPTTNPAQVMPNCSATSVAVPGEGTYAVLSSGAVTFTPLASFSGTATPLSYTVQDALGQIATTTITPTILPISPPTALPDNYRTPPMTPITVDPLANDRRGTGQLVPSTVLLCAANETAPACTSTSVTVNEGVFTLAANGRITFTPNSHFDAQHPAVVPYIVVDANGLRTSSVVTIVDPPAAIVPAPLVALVNTGLTALSNIPTGTALLLLGIAILLFTHIRRRALKPVASLAESDAFTDLLRRLSAVDEYKPAVPARLHVDSEGAPELLLNTDEADENWTHPESD